MAACLTVAGAALMTQLVSGGGPRAATATDLGDRLARLEASEQQRDRTSVRRGVQLALTATATAAGAEGPGDDEGTPEGDARELQRETARQERERQHYDQLDAVARTGDGGRFEADLRKKLEATRQLSKDVMPTPLDVRNIECSAAVCRVELKLRDPRQILAAARALGPGMAGMSMRPLSGDQAIYYFGTPGHQLPDLQP
jgi:hypothetical protein